MNNEKTTLNQCLSEGLNLATLTPFKDLGDRVGLSEAEVIFKVKDLLQNKSIKRFGIITKNRELGFNQNAMVVLNIKEDQIDFVASDIIKNSQVTLCYQRAPIVDVWNFNLYFMIHGKERHKVEVEIRNIIYQISDYVLDYKILFSSKCFKQKGARYL